jgi:hypothetical protein
LRASDERRHREDVAPWTRLLGRLASRHGGLSLRIGAAVIAGLVARGLVAEVAGTVPALGVAIAVAPPMALFALLADRFAWPASTRLRPLGTVIRSYPIASLAIVVPILIGVPSGLADRWTTIASCDRAAAAATAASKDPNTFAVSDPNPLPKLESLKQEFERGKAMCQRYHQTAQIAAMDAAFDTLQKSAQSSACMALADQVRKDVDRMNGSHEATETLRLLKAFKAKLQATASACDAADQASVSTSMRHLEASQVDPQISAAERLVAQAKAQRPTGGPAAPLPQTIEDSSCPPTGFVRIEEREDGKMHGIKCTGKALLDTPWAAAEQYLRGRNYETTTGSDTTTLRARRTGELVVFTYAHQNGKGDAAPKCVYADWDARKDWREVVARYTGGIKPDGPSIVDPPQTSRLSIGARRSGSGSTHRVTLEPSPSETARTRRPGPTFIDCAAQQAAAVRRAPAARAAEPPAVRRDIPSLCPAGGWQSFF